MNWIEKIGKTAYQMEERISAIEDTNGEITQVEEETKFGVKKKETIL